MTTTSTANQNASAQRPFQPIFTATVTPASVSTRTGKNGKYAFMQGATVETAKMSKQITVMAFGKAREEVAAKLRKGRPVKLAVQFDGGTLRVIGFPRAKQDASAQAV